MHQTLYKNVLGCIDSINSKISGWYFYKSDNGEFTPLPVRCILEIDSERNCVKYPLIIERQDVVDFYLSSEILKCGWELSLTENQKLKEIQVKITLLSLEEDDTQNEIDNWVTIFSNPGDFFPKLNINIPSFIVIDNFYQRPDQVRNFALKQTFDAHPNNHKGKRTNNRFLFSGLKERFEFLLGTKIKDWERYGTNGCFQYCIGGDQIVYHHDGQDYAGVLYLTPNAPSQTGTNFFKSIHTKKMKAEIQDEKIVFKKGFLDKTEFELVDTVGNIFNRLVLFDAKIIHAASEYFGTDINDGRLFQLFFFDIEK